MWCIQEWHVLQIFIPVVFLVKILVVLGPTFSKQITLKKKRRLFFEGMSLNTVITSVEPVHKEKQKQID